MSKIFTTPEAEQKAKNQMRYFLIAGGLQQPKANESLPDSFSCSSYLADSKIICDELVNRDFANIDQTLNDIVSYMPRAKNEDTLKPETIAEMIVYVAELLQLYWDDTKKTSHEIEEFKKTLLGGAVYKYDCYITAQDKKTKDLQESNGGWDAATKDYTKEELEELHIWMRRG